MRIKRLALFIILLLLLIACGESSGPQADESTAVIGNAKTTIDGFWNNNFPVTGEMRGYRFFQDKTYVFIWGGSTKSNFEGSFGKWRTSEGKLYIQPQRNILWKTSWLEGPNGPVPGDNNELYAAELTSSDWIMVSDFISFSEPRDRGTGDIIPVSLNIIYYIGEIRNSVRFYKIYDSSSKKIADMKDILEKYKSVKVK